MKDVSRISNSTFNLNISLIKSDYQKDNRTLFVILPTLNQATKYYDFLFDLLPDSVLFYPVDELVLSSLAIASRDFKYERINTIINLLDNQHKIVVTNVNGLLRKTIDKSLWEESSYLLEAGRSYNIEFIKKKLVELGYKKTSITEEVGSFSARGSIIDYFPIGLDNPIRLDFFGDELESIKQFEVSTQRSYNTLKTTKINPYVELILKEEERKNIINKLKKYSDLSFSEKEIIENDISNLDLGNNLDQLFYYGQEYYPFSSIIQYANDKRLYIIDEEKMLENYQALKQKNEQFYQELNSKVLINYPLFSDLDSVLKDQNIIYIDLHKNKQSYDLKATEILPFSGKLELLGREVGVKLNKEYVIISSSNLEHIKRIKEYFWEVNIPYKSIDSIEQARLDVVNFINVDYPSMYLQDEKMYIVNDQTIYPIRQEKRKNRYKSTFNEGNEIKYYKELEPGDYIVHINHGIGYYEGIKTIELSNRKRDYLSIRYDKNEHLYIPIEQLTLIKKYIGKEGVAPKLTRLGSNSWSKTKAKLVEKLAALSHQLVDLYAKREKAEGHQFSPDNEFQEQFERDFLYEETKDQMAAIKAVKEDMESKKPMDRLICGDVGYGKTEVALRAAFKAVMDGMQVCYLAPTTILARQHYYTFKDRMEKFGISVALLSRFVKAKEQKEILAKLKKGQIDVLIGTHRVLSDDVVFKNLGLLVTDEEQRFGVMHKEKIKQLRINVDSLMLSATPIPRTLQMSLIGIKELSLIETPPKDRYPVQTYVIPRSDLVIKEAIEREMSRGGQTFYLYNFTDDIEQKAYDIAKLVPEASIAYVHGKMNKNKIEEVISDFIDKKYDVLVSTTIIETGIDIPEANTLLINDSDRLGLSQLYQIRGRVGRSDKIAYAYLMYEPRKVLSSDAIKRLDSIKEYTELGSGFKIAMRDLAIRGAGDLLGAEQSGFIDSVGLDTYMEILDKTLETEEKNIKGIKQEEKKSITSPKLTTVLSDRFIPEKYQLDEGLKIEIHDKVSRIKNLSDIDDLSSEFEDRFGKVDASLRAYMYEKLFIHLINTIGIDSIDVKPTLLTVSLSEELSQKIDGEYLFRKAYELSDDFNIIYKDYKITIYLKLNRFNESLWLIPICKLLSSI